MSENQHDLDYIETSSETNTENVHRERFSNRAVLFVDDDERWIKILARWFKDTPYKCHFVHGAFEALEILAKEDIDLVISDMSMPIMTGGQLMKEIQTKYPDVTRVIMSGKFDLMSTIDAINSGQIYRYIVKPCKSIDIKLVVYECLRRLEKIEKKKTRDREARKSRVTRIKTMAKSIAQMNASLEMAHHGVIQIIQNLVLQSPDDQVRASQSVAVLRGICKQLDFKPEPSRELELAATFLQFAFNASDSLKLDDKGKVAFDTIGSEHATLIEESSDILVKLGSPIAGQIVKQFASFNCSCSLSLDDDAVAVGSALILLVRDLCILIDEFKIEEQLALVMLEPHAQRYGTKLFYDVLQTFTYRPINLLAG